MAYLISMDHQQTCSFCSASRRSSATLNANTMTFSQKSLVLSVTPVSETTAYMLYFTSSLQLVMRTFAEIEIPTDLVTFPLSLREMDIELMRRLSPRVNVIPVIGKADSLTPSELRGFKKRVCLPGFVVATPLTLLFFRSWRTLNITVSQSTTSRTTSKKTMKRR